MNGGFSSVVWVLREACAIDPLRFLGLFSSFVTEKLHHDYIHAVVGGISNHLRYRFGNVKANIWEPADPLPDGKTLATALMNLLERHSIIWKDEQTVSRALEACCDVLNDSESADRLTLLLFWVRSRVSDDEHISIPDSESKLVSDALNSARGIAAKSAIKLANRLLEKDQPLPELLPYLLEHFAHDSAIYPRFPILDQLPFLMYKQPDLGWRLLANIFQEPQPHLWKHAERCLSYQYRDHFHQVAPYLARLVLEGMEEAGDAWGRISTLVSLEGYISQEALFITLADANGNAWQGVTQVFTANLAQRKHTAVCHAGLIAILRHENLSDDVISEIGACFAEEESKGLIQPELVLAFLNSLTGGHDLHDFLEWLSHEAPRNPLFTLEVTEMLAEKLESGMGLYQIWDTQPLVTALNEILREADETDDPKLIQRAITLQDRFLRMDIHEIQEGIEELFAKAGQH